MSLSRHNTATPLGFAAAYRRDAIAPVYLYKTSPLQRKGIIYPYGFMEDHTDMMPPPRQASPATPPQEGNYLPLRFYGRSYRHDATTPSGCACHPSTGGELVEQTRRVRADNRKCPYPCSLSGQL